MKRHFVVKLMALTCFGFVAKWNEIFCGDSLKDLSLEQFTYLKNFYRVENLRINSEYIFEDDLDNYVSYDLDEEIFGVI